MSLPPRDWVLGRHTLRFEPPDLFWARFVGTLELSDVKASVAIYRELSEARPFIFVAELGQMGRLEPEAARYLTDNIPPEWILANVYVGGRLVHRAIAKGLALAARLSPFADEHGLEKIHHVATPDEARALIVQLRARRQGGGA